MPAVEVIDLTTSPTNSVIVVDGDTPDLVGTISTNDPLVDKPPSKKKRKKRAKAKVVEETIKDGSNSINSNSADQSSSQISPSRGQKRKRIEGEELSSQPKSGAGASVNAPTELPLFAIDTAGQPLGNHIETNNSQSKTDQKTYHTQDGLLLPSHVSVALDVAVSVNGKDQETGDRPLSPISDVSGIEFWDDVLAAGAARYFHDTATIKPYKTCKRCGDNDHEFKDCPNIICLTCGARNEHSSRSCPILRYCFNCQGKGHLAKDCPRIGPTEGRRTSSRDCDRCGSLKHHSTNCPTLWRIYTYHTDSERDAVLAEREAERDLPFDEGGEGFIARDHWCYNCGQSGHLGDDCREVKFNFDRPEDYSAFGRYNCLTGPFASSAQSSQYQRAPRTWELAPPTRGGIPLDAQEDIGRKGREKAKKRAREAQNRLEGDDNDDDVPDWFNRNREKSRAEPKPTHQRGSGSSEPKRQPLVFRITSEQKDPRFANRRDDSRPRPALLSRIDMEGGEKESKRYRDRDRNRGQNRKRDGDRERRRQLDYPERDGNRHRPNERRWRGGYDR